jgi:predicted transcriptional regulator
MTLAPELEARVRAVADRSGLPPEAALSRLLEAALTDEEQQFQETVAALRASMHDFAAGRSVSLEEWRAESRAWVDAHLQTAPAKQQP